jgi:hypothetical protein
MMLMQRLRRLLLGALTVGAPVFLAACYGPAIRYSADGKVVDKATGAGISGATVQCVEPGGKAGKLATTRADGAFDLVSRTECEKLTVADGSGKHASVTVPGDGKRPMQIALEARAP